jgi:hypothetical protein
LSIWLVLAKRLKAFSFPTVLGSLALATTFHAIYNLLVSRPGVTSVIAYILPPFTAVLLFFLYRMIPKRLLRTE